MHMPQLTKTHTDTITTSHEPLTLITLTLLYDSYSTPNG